LQSGYLFWPFREARGGLAYISNAAPKWHTRVVKMAAGREVGVAPGRDGDGVGGGDNEETEEEQYRTCGVAVEAQALLSVWRVA